MSGPAPAGAASPEPFPRRGWALVGASAALAAVALVLARAFDAAWALPTAAGCAAVGFGLVQHAFKLARRSHARGPLMACGLLLGFLAIPLVAAVALAVLVVLAPQR